MRELALAGASVEPHQAEEAGAVREMSKKVVGAVAPVALLVALVSWAFASPVGSSPDDDYHMASIWCGAGVREGLCEPGDGPGEMRVPEALVTISACYAYQDEQSASCELAPIDSLVNTNRGNFSGDYPPVYYATLSLFAGDDIEASIVTMRVFNAVLFVGILTLLYFLSTARMRTPLMYGIMVTMVPLGMFIVSSVNPSSWAVLAGAGLWIALTNFYAERDRNRRIALVAMVLGLTVMGSGARSDSAVYAGVAVLVAAALSFERSRRFVTSSLLGVVVIGVSLFFFFTSGQSALVDLDSSPQPGNLLVLVFGNLILLPELWIGVFGYWGLGWLDTQMPGTVWVTTFAVFAALCFWGMRVWTRRKAVAAAIVAFSLIVVPMYVYVHDGVMVGGYVQPRYVYPLIIMLAGVLLVRGLTPVLELRRVQGLTIVALLAVAHAIALHINIRRYVTGVDVFSPNLDSQIEWWWALPFGPIWIWAVGAIAFAVAVLAAYLHSSTFTLTPLEQSELPSSARSSKATS